MNKNSNTVRTIVEVGIFAAIGFVLDEIQGIAFGSVFTAGGSIGFAMVAVLIIAFRRGWLPAMATGLIMGSLDLITKASFVTFWQVLLDYILPYTLVGTAGFFKPWFDSEEKSQKKILILVLGGAVGGLLKFMSHFIVGTLVWAPMGYDWAIADEALYSFAYNIAYTGPSIVLSVGLLIALYKRAPQTISIPSTTKEEVKEKVHIKAYDYVINPLAATCGLFLFVFYLVGYIQNFKITNKSYAIKISSDGDAVFLMFVGLLLLIIFGIAILRTLKHKQHNRLNTISLIALASSSLIYSIARILICYFDEFSDAKIYFVWMSVSFVLLVIFIGLYLLVKQILTKEEKTEPTI